jgi:hypothetical protein
MYFFPNKILSYRQKEIDVHEADFGCVNLLLYNGCAYLPNSTQGRVDERVNVGVRERKEHQHDIHTSSFCLGVDT